jgi:hypothetical protein
LYTINHAKGVIMIADILTKGQARPIFLQLLKLLDDYSKNSITSSLRTNTVLTLARRDQSRVMRG